MPPTTSHLDDAVGPRTVRVPGGGLLLTADVYGDPAAPAVVLLHGGGQTRHAWGGAAAALARAGYHGVSVDLRGHGDSDWSPDGSYGMTEFAGDVRALSRAFATAAGPPAFVGASMGGLSIMVAVGETPADEQPGLARCVVLVDVAPRIEPEGSSKILGFMSAGLRGFDTLEDAADSIAAYIPHRPRPSDVSGLRKNLRQRADDRWYWHWDPRWMTGRMGVDGQTDEPPHDRFLRAVGNLAVPTLLVRGGISDIVSEESVTELRAALPSVEVVDIAGAGHMVAGDRNDVFNSAVVDFVSRFT